MKKTRAEQKKKSMLCGFQGGVETDFDFVQEIPQDYWTATAKVIRETERKGCVI